MAKGKGSGKKKAPKLSPEERSRRAAQRAFARQVRTIFLKMGYSRIADAADKEFTFETRTSDFDDIFVRQNIIVCCEHTLTKESNIGDHIKNKAHLYNLIHSQPARFIEFLKEKFPSIAAAIPADFHSSQLRLRIVYCSETEIKDEYQALCPETKFLWRGSIKYFKSLAETVKLSARHELAEFLGLPFAEVGENGSLPSSDDASKFRGMMLPEAHSNFPAGYKVVSFYVSPAALLSRAYVLRKDGWKDDTGLYQRMIDKDKVESIRKYLRREERTFVNNVIVTLPNDAKVLDISGNTVNPTGIEATTPVTIQLPLEANSIGIVDGQHRIFSYYEDVVEDKQISIFRSRQNLLATGIMYPADLPIADRNKFEAGLFLEINSTQNAARSDLKQAIAVITAPFSPDSVGKRIIARLGIVGPLEAMVERHFFDVGVLKTTSIVSYGLRPLIRIDGEESLFKIWESDQKKKVEKGESVEDLLKYVSFATSEINKFLGAARAVLGSEKWAVKSKTGDGLLSVTSVNALLILFRKVVMHQGLQEFDIYKDSLGDLAAIDFGKYHSSQYNRMADDIFKLCYAPKSGDE